MSCAATDGEGNVGSCVFPVKVVDTRAPVVTLNGPAALTLRRGVDTYVEQGATAEDECEGDLSAQVVTSGSVDTAVVGRYSVSYTVTDASGNTASATREVEVVGEPVCPAEPPEKGWSATGRLSAQRLQHTATRLTGGKVLVVGGFTWATELYEPATGSWSASGSALATHREHTATLLVPGRWGRCALRLAPPPTGRPDVRSNLGCSATVRGGRDRPVRFRGFISFQGQRGHPRSRLGEPALGQ